MSKKKTPTMELMTALITSCSQLVPYIQGQHMVHDEDVNSYVHQSEGEVDQQACAGIFHVDL